MKIYVLVTVVNDRTFDAIVSGSTVKPSNSVQNYLEMLIKGLSKTGADLECHVIPAISAYPGGNMLFWGSRKEVLGSGVPVRWLPAVNVQVLKQFTLWVSAFLSILNWLVKNRNDKNKTILTYSVYPPFAHPMQFLGRVFQCRTTAIIPDLPEYLYNTGKRGFIYKFKSGYIKTMVKLQGNFDNYILLTEQMTDRLGVRGKPVLVMEGFSDSDIFNGIGEQEKNKVKTVCYAGALNESFGIKNLLEAFMIMDGRYALWLYGAGDMESYIGECVRKDGRIVRFGKVDRASLLTAQKKADLLISVKPASRDQSDYAFPSKVIEYMTSGTPVLSTRAGGIPKEYFDYIYPIDEEDARGMARRMKETLDKPAAELKDKGETAKQFIISNKNCYVQTKRMFEFVRENI